MNISFELYYSQENSIFQFLNIYISSNLFYLKKRKENNKDPKIFLQLLKTYGCTRTHTARSHSQISKYPRSIRPVATRSTPIIQKASAVPCQTENQRESGVLGGATLIQ